MNPGFTTETAVILKEGVIPNEKYNSFNTTTSDYKDECVPLSKPYLLFVSVGPALVSVENLVFLFAVLMYRMKLRHNNVYTYVTSALIANLVTSLWAFYHFLNYYYGLESADPSFWWAFRKGLTAGFSLILCGNIGLLIYAIEDDMDMMGRLVSGTMSSKKSNTRMTRTFRLRKALMLIVAVWIFPVTFGLLSMTPWNCTKQCTCTLYLKSGKPICEGKSCSNLYTPMSKSYLFVIVIVWFCECVFLIFVISKAAISFPRRNDSSRSAYSYDEENGIMQSENRNNNRSERKITHMRRFSPRVARPHRFPSVLLGLFILCTAPVMVLFVLDFCMEDFQAGNIVINIITPLPLLYCLVSPILLTNRLHGMKSALFMTLSFNWLKGGVGGFRWAQSKRNGSSANHMRSSMISQTSDYQKGESMPTQV